MTFFELGLVLASALLHAVWSASIKGSGDPLVFNFYQGGVTLLLSAAVLPLLDYGEITTPAWRWLGVTAVAHALYFYWLTRALEHGDLTLVYPIARSTPAFLPLIAIPLFSEPVRPLGVVGIAIVQHHRCARDRQPSVHPSALNVSERVVPRVEDSMLRAHRARSIAMRD